MPNPTSSDVDMRGWPLCRVYLLVAIESIEYASTNSGVSSECHTVHWAFGLLEDGQGEVLDAWDGRRDNQLSWPERFASLKNRGAEKVAFVISDKLAIPSEDLGRVYPGAKLLTADQYSTRPTGTLLRRLNPPMSSRQRHVVLVGQRAIRGIGDFAARSIANRCRLRGDSSQASVVLGALRRAEERSRS